MANATTVTSRIQINRYLLYTIEVMVHIRRIIGALIVSKANYIRNFF
jgi:hypothetical protein